MNSAEFPEVNGKIERSLKIHIDGFDLDGKEQKAELEGFPARVCQHEFDHLEGILIIDKMSPAERKREDAGAEGEGSEGDATAGGACASAGRARAAAHATTASATARPRRVMSRPGWACPRSPRRRRPRARCSSS